MLVNYASRKMILLVEEESSNSDFSCTFIPYIIIHNRQYHTNTNDTKFYAEIAHLKWKPTYNLFQK